MNKKAIEEMLLTVIIGIVIFVLMLSLTTTINAAINKERQREICRLSIVDAELKKTATVGLARPHINCPMQEETIEKRDLPKTGKEDYVKRIFAEYMRDTWIIAGQGVHRTFQQKYFGGGSIHCLVYARINLAGSELSKKDINSVKMTDWLTTRNPSDSSESYFKYLIFENDAGDFARAWHIVSPTDPMDWSSEEIDPSKNYYIIYWSALQNSGIWSVVNEEENLKKISNFVFSKDEEIPNVLIVPEEYSGKIGCEYFLN